MTLDRTARRTGREPIVGLDLLRIAAALMILVYHAYSIASKNAAREGTAIVASPHWWSACIDLFFVMSGFLMVYMSRSLYGSLRGAGVFAARRLVRTPPLYWFYTILFAIAWTLVPSLPGATPIDGLRLVESLFFVPADRGPIILVAWTLYLEVLFYVIFSLTLLLRYPLGPWIAIAVLAGLSLVGLLPGVATSHFALWTDPLILDFCLGIGVALLFFEGATLHPWGRVFAVALALGALAALPELGTRNFLRVPTYGFAAACLVAVATWQRPSVTQAAWHKRAAAVGAMAYSLYLSHITFLKITEGAYFRLVSGPVACYVYVGLGSLVSIGGGWLAYRFIEAPLSRRLRPLVPSLKGRLR